jgi:hypothetical protein
MSSFLLLRLPGGVGVRVDARGGSRPPRLRGAARAGRGEGRHAHQLPLLHTCSSRYVQLVFFSGVPNPDNPHSQKRQNAEILSFVNLKAFL